MQGRFPPAFSINQQVTMPLFKRFQTLCDQTSYTRFLIAFSGGLDSTALLSLFIKLRQNRPHFELRAIHIHHGLSSNADAWVIHCQHICATFNVPLIVEKVQVEQTDGIEAGARQARYQAIARHLQADEILVTAHHLQDQTETFLLALKRGSGIQGLGAMQTQSTVYDLPIFRPLLSFSRQQLEKHVQSENLNWIEDESNADNRYDRNFLRNEILPQLKNRWPHFDQAVQRSAQHCFEQQQLINELLAEEFWKNYQKTDRTFNLSNFAQFSVHKQRVLIRLWLAQLQLEMLSLAQLDQLIRDVIFARQDANPQFKLGEKLVRRYQQKLYLTDKFADLREIQIDIIPNQRIALPDGLGEFIALRQENSISFQWLDKISTLAFTEKPIQIRFKYSGKVKLAEKGVNEDIKKIWQNLSVPPWQRNRIPLIFYGEHLKSAVGFFEVFEKNR